MKRFFLLPVIAVCFFLSCGKSGDVIPSVAVNYQVSTTDPHVAALNAPGGSVFIKGYGVAGLILYRESDGTYAAYDQCSSYMPQKACAVTLDSGGLTVTDPCSGSKFLLLDGTPVKAPATKSLRSYSITVANFEIFVSN